MDFTCLKSERFYIAVEAARPRRAIGSDDLGLVQMRLSPDKQFF